MKTKNRNSPSITNTELVAAAEHLQRRLLRWRNDDERVWRGFVRLNGKPDEAAVKQYACIAQDLRRQLLEQLAKSPAASQQGQLFE